MNLVKASAEFSTIMKHYPGFWCVAGGWAIDLFLGKQTREHEDLEVVVLRRDNSLLHQHFPKAKKIIPGDPPQFLPWDGAAFEPEVIQLRLGEDFDFLLTPAEGENWVCRRWESLQLPLQKVVGRTKEGVPFLNPEVVLLFKAKYVRDKDVSDFSHAAPRLSESSRIWLRETLALVHPGHEWISKLD